MRAYYSANIKQFVLSEEDDIIGKLATASEFAVEETQLRAWKSQISILKPIVDRFEGKIYFEFSIPRMGKRVDVLLVVKSLIFLLEFKVGSNSYDSSSLNQVWDYALDLGNFHQTSHQKHILPILIATEAKAQSDTICIDSSRDNLYHPIRCNAENLELVLVRSIELAIGEPLEISEWERGSYRPTPTIIEAARALYDGHSVKEIARYDAGAKNLDKTTDSLLAIINEAKQENSKSICLVTGVPGAGKTLVGLNLATARIEDSASDLHVFLSGNGPLVQVLQEALTRDRVERSLEAGKKLKKGEAKGEVRAFIQNVHHYRDEYLKDTRAPADHVAIFDEAQRAWNTQQTAKFMKEKRGDDRFEQSEPEFLISCIDRHQDWGVIVCLIGGGQEINTGEAGVSEWLNAINRSFPHWQVYLSQELKKPEHNASDAISDFTNTQNLNYNDELHLSSSMRSFRAENLSLLVQQILNYDELGASDTLKELVDRYPIVLTRSLQTAKRWLRKQARGSERYGVVVSSQAERLKPLAIDVRSPMNPIHWFLSDKGHVKSSYYMESVATEFQIQGLELDWVCVAWDADFRMNNGSWQHKSFRGNKWQNINKPEKQNYLLNAYRVLLTRARQGMVIVVPEGDPDDHSRLPEFYDETYAYMKKIGIVEPVFL